MVYHLKVIAQNKEAFERIRARLDEAAETVVKVVNPYRLTIGFDTQSPTIVDQLTREGGTVRNDRVYSLE